MIQFKLDTPARCRSHYVVTGYKGTGNDGQEVRILFIIGKRFAVYELGIREAQRNLDILLEHPKVKTYVDSTIRKFERKKSFAKSFYVIPEVNEALASYFDGSGSEPNEEQSLVN